jgi:hypothetical protein
VPALQKFADGQRVRVLPPHKLANRTGTVVRLRRAEYGAWVAMDEQLPTELRVFPPGDKRERHASLYPDECEAV